MKTSNREQSAPAGDPTSNKIAKIPSCSLQTVISWYLGKGLTWYTTMETFFDLTSLLWDCVTKADNDSKWAVCHSFVPFHPECGGESKLVCMDQFLISLLWSSWPWVGGQAVVSWGWVCSHQSREGRTKLLMTPALSTIHPDPHLTANSIFAFLLTSLNVWLFEIDDCMPFR